jgi:Ala-tRNA(Pro) deacylase
MATATWIREDLERSGVAYEELHHQDAYTAQQVAQREHISGRHVAKVVGVMVDDRPVEVVLPASRRVNLDRVKEVLGAQHARLASETELEQFFTDCEVGAIPALRHWRGVEVVMDAYLGGRDVFILGGTHRDVLRVRFDDWFKMVNPRVEWLSDPA